MGIFATVTAMGIRGARVMAAVFIAPSVLFRIAPTRGPIGFQGGGHAAFAMPFALVLILATAPMFRIRH
jgi:hypothetical protein